MNWSRFDVDGMQDKIGVLGSDLVTEMSLQDFPTNSRPSRPHGGRSQKLVLICGFFAWRGLM